MSTISTSGISPSSIIRAEHVLRIIDALSNTSENDILISGSLTVTGSTLVSGSLNVTGGITGSLLGTSSYSMNALTASYVLGASNDTGSLLLTASVNANIITFTKGDASTFDITVNTGSASSIDTGSFATTGSNQFLGNQTITGSVSITNILTLQPNDPLLTSQPTGSISTSGSGVDCKPYFYNGTTWTSLI